jgi:hypothetical protein
MGVTGVGEVGSGGRCGVRSMQLVSRHDGSGIRGTSGLVPVEPLPLPLPVEPEPLPLPVEPEPVDPEPLPAEPLLPAGDGEVDPEDEPGLLGAGVTGTGVVVGAGVEMLPDGAALDEPRLESAAGAGTSLRAGGTVSAGEPPVVA